jgi:hypothetical protein
MELQQDCRIRVDSHFTKEHMMTLELPDIALPEQADVKIALSISSRVNITDVVAQRKVTRLLLEQVGNLLYGGRPTLVAGRRLLWRVPVFLGLPTHGEVGQVGWLDVDAQSGEIPFTQQTLDELAERGDALAERASHPTE